MFVSIHAPVKSATIAEALNSIYGISFNPRARKERDAKCMLQLRQRFCFNPRARKERDIVPVVKWTERKGFNPRARKERDFSQRWLLLY